MGTDQKKPVEGRRNFLKLAGVGAVGAAAAAVGTTVATEVEAATGTGGKGYQETAHVKKFYETASF